MKKPKGIAERETTNREAMRTLSSAIAQDRLTLAYQPAFSARMGEMPAFVECLARIQEPDGTLTSAGPLIAEVEETQLGRLLDKTVLRKVIETLREAPGRRLSLNISAAGVGDLAWLKILQDADAQTPGIAEWLIVEITETSTLNLNAAALDFLFELRRLGTSLAIDDFGAGHTSLQQLGKFRFDFLKIDASFCSNVAGKPEAERRLGSILRIARHFDMVTVAEGVERKEDADFLTAAGVDCLQGFYFGMPTPELAWAENLPLLKGSEGFRERRAFWGDKVG